jgi:hypothetical protein
MALGIDIITIQNSIPDNLKRQGIDKLSSVLIKKGEEIKTQIEPKLTQEIQKAKDVSLCDDIEKLNQLIQTRNNIVNKLNNISKFVNQVSLAFTGISTLLQLLILAKNILDVTTLASYIALGFAPAVPGAAITAIGTAQDASNKITYNSLGASRLEKAQNVIGGAAIAIAVLSATIKSVILLLNQLDIELSKCANVESKLDPVDQNLIDISNQVIEAEATINESTYKGFTIEVETVPYTNTVDRYRAIGVNSDGIKLIETPLSFTTNKQTLIDELKFIIDRDNLKAN